MGAGDAFVEGKEDKRASEVQVVDVRDAGSAVCPQPLAGASNLPSVRRYVDLFETRTTTISFCLTVRVLHILTKFAYFIASKLLKRNIVNGR